jgi:hypothetical protein
MKISIVAILNCLIFPGDDYLDQHSSQASSLVTSLCIVYLSLISPQISRKKAKQKARENSLLSPQCHSLNAQRHDHFSMQFLVVYIWIFCRF